MVDTLSMAIDEGKGEMVAFAPEPPDTVSLWRNLMRTTSKWLVAFIVGLGVTVVHAQDKYLGVWSGGWQAPGGAAGGMEITLEKGKDTATAGRVSVTGEPTYKATFKTVTFDGPKMTARYDFPPDESIEIVLEATVDGATAKGTWTAREKASGNVVADGTFDVTRK